MIDDRYLNFKSELAKIHLEQISESLCKLDITVKNQDGSFRDFIDVMEDLQDVWKKVIGNE